MVWTGELGKLADLVVGESRVGHCGLKSKKQWGWLNREKTLLRNYDPGV